MGEAASQPRANRLPFFVTGGTMPVGAASYVERQADKDLFDRLQEGHLCYVLNARQMGKSSLMVRCAKRLQEAGHRTAILDLTAVGQSVTPEQWYYGLLNLLGQQTDNEDSLDDFWFDNEALGPMQRFFTALRQVALPSLASQQRLVLFIDEIDAVRSITTFNTDEFFAGIRQCFIGRATESPLQSLTFCLLGTATPAELIKDTRITPFNTGRRIELHDFTPEEAAPLTGKHPRILYWTGGHPYLTQRIASIVSDLPSATVKEVDEVVSRLFLAHGMLDTDDNLSLVSNRLLLADADRFSLLSLYRQVLRGRKVADDDTNPLCDVLKLSGVVTVEKGLLRVRNEIYRRVFDATWVEKHLPGVEVRRQKAAFVRGLAIAGAIAGIVLCVIGSLAYIATQQTARANQKADDAERVSYAANMNLIQSKWDENNIGRMRELLEETRNYKDKGFEWGYWNRMCHLDLMTLKGHMGTVSSVAFSPDGKRIVTGSEDNTAKVWDVASGKEILTLKGHMGTVSSVVFSPDGKRIVTGSRNNWNNKGNYTAKVWNAVNGKELLAVQGHSESNHSIAFSPDGRRIVTKASVRIEKVLEAIKVEGVFSLKGHSTSISSVAFSPDGKRLVTGSYDHTAKIWDVKSSGDILVLKGYISNKKPVAFSPDGKRTVTYGLSKIAKIWDKASSKEM